MSAELPSSKNLRFVSQRTFCLGNFDGFGLKIKQFLYLSLFLGLSRLRE